MGEPDHAAAHEAGNAALFRLMSWMSPAYPVGAFAYSGGIEWAVEAGDIRDADSLRDWLAAMIRHGSAGCDGVLFCQAHRAVACGDDGALAAVAELAAALTGSKERFLETTAQGEAFLKITRAAWPTAALDRLTAAWDGPLAYPVAVGGGLRRARHCAGTGAGGLSPRLGVEPDFRRRAAHSARPDRRPARAGRARSRDRRRGGIAPRRPRSTLSRSRRPAPTSPACVTRPNIRGCSVHDRNAFPRTPAGRRRRPGRLRQDVADGYAVQAPARPLRHRGHHQRHLHQVGRRISHPLGRAAAGAHRRRRDRRLPAHRDPRGRLDEPRRGRAKCGRNFPASI